VPPTSKASPYGVQYPFVQPAAEFMSYIMKVKTPAE